MKGTVVKVKVLTNMHIRCSTSASGKTFTIEYVARMSNGKWTPVHKKSFRNKDNANAVYNALVKTAIKHGGKEEA